MSLGKNEELRMALIECIFGWTMTPQAGNLHELKKGVSLLFRMCPNMFLVFVLHRSFGFVIFPSHLDSGNVCGKKSQNVKTNERHKRHFDQCVYRRFADFFVFVADFCCLGEMSVIIVLEIWFG